MYIMHIALGGCLKAPPVHYGLTEDTGGHIAYVLGAAQAQARRDDVSRVDILTRLFDEPGLGVDYARPLENIGPKLRILRLASASAGYLSKERLEAELPALCQAFLALLADLPRRPDLLHCHFADAAELGRAARARFGIPLLYTPHSLAIDKLGCLGGDCAPRVARELAAIRQADAIIASSRDEAERQIPAYDAASAGRVWCINPGIALPPGGGDAQALLSGLDRPDLPFLLAVARPVRKKNLLALLDAYQSSPALRARCNLVILAGQDGVEPDQQAIRAALRDRVAAAGLHGSVLLPARHDAALVPRLYGRCAALGGVFVNPALHEPFGLTLIEAAQFGLPVVTTRNGGPRDIVGTLGHGLLVDPTAPRAMAAACLRLLRDRGLWRRLSRNGRARHGLFNWDLWAGRVALIGARLLAKTPPFRPKPLPQVLLAFDIDGTLTGCPVGAARFADWAATARERRYHVTVATGRPISDARRVLADWSLPEPAVMITSVGSEIWRADRRGSLRLCADYAGWIGQDWDPAAIRGVLAGLDLTWQADHEQRGWKLSLNGSAGQAARVAAALDGAGLAARVIASHGRFIDILPARSGKSGALRHEAARLGLSLHDCLVAGDSGNDACMLMAAGRAILVGNALPELLLPDRPGLYRAGAAHGLGVIEGLAHFGLGPAAVPQTIPAE